MKFLLPLTVLLFGLSACSSGGGEVDKTLEEAPTEELRSEEASVPKHQLDILGRSFAFVYIPEGSYMRGSEKNPDSRPVRELRISPFFMLEHELTFSLFDLYCEETKKKKPKDGGWGRGQQPAINVNWDEAQDFCAWLQQETGLAYRLPTEAEWEYAARGGEEHRFAGSDELDEVAWHGLDKKDRSIRKTMRAQTAKQKKPNAFGLYDMSGNVWEWCQDAYAEDYYGDSPSENPPGPSKGKVKVLRGGSWYNGDEELFELHIRRRFPHHFRSNYSGFRLALSASELDAPGGMKN